MAIYSPAISLAERPSLSRHDVAQVGSDVFGAVGAVKPLTGGSNPDIFSVQGDAGNGVLKFFPEGSRLAEFEAASMRRASDAGIPAPEIFGEGVLETEAGDRPWVAMEHAAGKPLSELVQSDSDRESTLRSIGRLIAELHMNSRPAPEGFWRQTDTDDDGKPVWRFSGWHEYLTNMEETLQDKAGTLSASGLTNAEIGIIMKNISEYKSMSPETSVFCHADLRLEHVGIDQDNKIVSVIDWGSAQANSPEREFSKPLTVDDSPMIDSYAESFGTPKKELHERVRRMQLAHLPALVIFNVEKNRPEDTLDRVTEVRSLINQ